jgi:homocysteine S-methyltransferase
MISEGRPVLFDGAMGTMIYEKGVFINLCFDNLNLTNPRLIEGIHKEYVLAGCDVLETNTFGANRINLARYALADRVLEINKAGARIAREAGGPGIMIAGSIGPLSANVEPLGSVSRQEATEAYREQADALIEGGADLLILETFSQMEMLEAAVEAVLRPKKVPVIAQLAVNDEGRTAFGTSLDLIVRYLDGTGVDVIGLNCQVGPAPMLDLLKRLTRMTAKPISVQPNAGYPREVGGRNIYMTTPEYLSEFAVQFLGNGASIIGGCCGTTPRHIRAMRQVIKSRFIEKERAAPEKTSVLAEAAPVPQEEKSRLASKLSRGEFIVSV